METRSGPESADLDTLRERVKAYLLTAPVGAQSRLAERASIKGGTLSKFIGGRGLPRNQFVALQLELMKAQRKVAA